MPSHFILRHFEKPLEFLAMPPARAQVDHSISGGGGPAPFLSKTYDMVGNSSTNDIISWSPTGNSFIVWDALEFARLLLPTYFKHNNFSSFIRQLNTYGFRKIDSLKWEFANEDFVKGEKHLLNNIRRKKPVHSHRYPQGSRADPERTAFKEEIERLSSEKAALQVNILMSEHQGSLTKIQVGDLMCRCRNMEQRQQKLLSLLVNAIDDPIFVEQLARKVECINGSTDKKKRRLPLVEVPEPDPENNSMNSRRGSPPVVEATFGQDSSDELRLQLTPSISDVNLGVLCTDSSNDDGLDMERKPFEGNCKDAGTRIEHCLFAPETVYHSCLDPNSTMPQNVDTNGSTSMNFLQEISFSEEGAGTRIKDCLFAPETDHSELDLNSAMLETSFSEEGAVTRSKNCLCAPKADHLELDLNSSMLQNSDTNRSSSMNSLQDLSFSGKHGIVCCQLTLASLPFSNNVGPCEREQRQELSKTPLEAHDTKSKGFPNNKDMVDEDNHKNASKKAATINEEHEAPTPPRVNDVFWEQFLTEKPGSSDNEGRSLIKSFKQVTLLSLWAAK